MCYKGDKLEQLILEYEKEKLLNLYDNMRKNVIGQDEALQLVSDCILKSRSGIKDPLRPIGSFIFLGPTGVGKTKLSIELAKRLDAEIINGDSVSIYKDLDIGSAKPTIEEREGIPHHLIDIRDVGDDYSVFDYQRDVRQKIDEITLRNKRVIIVGGTGLYIKAKDANIKVIEIQGENANE